MEGPSVTMGLTEFPQQFGLNRRFSGGQIPSPFMPSGV